MSNDKQPRAVCYDCGKRYREGATTLTGITLSAGTCEVCGEQKMVSPAYDYGWLKPEWRDYRSEEQAQ